MPITGAGGGGEYGGALAHEASIPRIAAVVNRQVLRKKDVMVWLLFEALAALAVLVGIVWWTMFSGRRSGEREDDKSSES